MRPAAISLFLTAEAVCWELPLERPWGSPLLTGLAGMLPVTPTCCFFLEQLMCGLSSVLKVHIHQLRVTKEGLPVYTLEELLRQERYRPFLYRDVIVQDSHGSYGKYQFGNTRCTATKIH